jgi:hypothetical protein
VAVIGGGCLAPVAAHHEGVDRATAGSRPGRGRAGDRLRGEGQRVNRHG